MSNIERKYAYHDDGVLPSVGEYGVTYLTLYSSEAGNIYDGWIYDPDHKTPLSETPRTFGYRNQNYTQYCWDDEVIVDLSNAQSRQESSEFSQGRIVAFNTSVSDQPIVLQDIDVTGLTEEQREAKATTILFTAIPLVDDSYIQAQVEVQMKCNLSVNNTSGEMRVEAFYILNDESDRTMRPNPIHTFSVTSANERHTLPWLYFNPALKHDTNNYIGVKLIVSGGTAEIGISDVREYGDAIITLTSAGLTGDKIYDAKPRRIWIEGETLVPMGYSFNKYDYDVFCEYDDGSEYIVTHFCDITPIDGTIILDTFLVEARYMGLHASLRVAVALVEEIEIMGLDEFHGEYTLNISDYTVLGYLENGDIWDVTNFCTYSPAMGTTITQNTVLTATFENPGGSLVSDSMDILAHSIVTFSKPSNGLIYTLYDDDYVVITGSVNTDTSELPVSSNWNTFGYREGLAVPYLSMGVRSTDLVRDHKWTVEWRASGAPSCILLGAKSASGGSPESAKGIGITRLVGFSSMDCSHVLYAEFINQPYLIGSNVRSFDLSANQLTTPAEGHGYSHTYLITAKDSTCRNSPLKFSYMDSLDGMDIRSWDLSRIKLFGGLFGFCPNLREVRMSNLDSAVSTANLFSNCGNLRTVEIDGITFHAWPGREEEPYTGGRFDDTSVDYMFRECSNLENVKITNANYDLIESVKYLFYNCRKVTDDALIVLADICSHPVRIFDYALYNCREIFDLRIIKDIDMVEAESVQSMLQGCMNINDVRPISGWKMSKVTNFAFMLAWCDKVRVIASLSAWDFFKTPRYDEETGDRVTVQMNGLFARSPYASARGDDFRSTHIIDANEFNPEGWKDYIKTAIDTRIYNPPILGTQGVYGPGWPGTTPVSVPELHWDDIVTTDTFEEIGEVTYPVGIFGGTDWAIESPQRPWTFHKESNVLYALPEWYYWQINYAFNRSLPYGEEYQDQYWNGSRDVWPSN